MPRQSEPRAATSENLLQYWDSEAEEIGSTPAVTIRDLYFRMHELHTLLPLVPAGSRLLDVGCGTGLGTLLLSRRSSATVGVDFSPQMISWANRLRDDPGYRDRILAEFSSLLGWSDDRNADLSFETGDVTNLILDDEPFDVIVGQRILINLPTHDEQMAALDSLRSSAVKGALLLVTEATAQGHKRTDDYRERFGLPPLEKYWHNKYVDEDRFDEWAAAGWQVTANLGFATYMLLSKVIYPAACGPENCQFLSAANAAAMEMSSLFRTSQAVAEMGTPAVAELYVHRVRRYDLQLADQLSVWIEAHIEELVGWEDLGHQRLVVAEAR